MIGLNAGCGCYCGNATSRGVRACFVNVACKEWRAVVLLLRRNVNRCRAHCELWRGAYGRGRKGCEKKVRPPGDDSKNGKGHALQSVNDPPSFSIEPVLH